MQGIMSETSETKNHQLLLFNIIICKYCGSDINITDVIRAQPRQVEWVKYC